MMAAPRLPDTPRLGALLAGLAEAGTLAELPVAGLGMDSRTLAPGEVFLACAGSRGHGLDHLDAALAAGAAAVLWEPAPGVAPPPPGLAVPAVAVPELGRRAGVIADRFFGEPSRALTVVGVTGTDGKTSVSHFMAQAWHEPGRPCGLLGTLGYGVYGALLPGSHTTPDPIALHRSLAGLRARGAQRAVMEVSSHALDQDRVSGVRFAGAVFTNLSQDHLDYHGHLEAYGAAKARLFSRPLAFAAVNGDDPFGRRLLESLDPGVTAVVYGLGARPSLARPAACWVWGEDLTLTPEGFSLSVVSDWGEGTLRAPLLGRFNASNLLAALAALLAGGLDLTEALRRLARTRAVPGRMERLGGAGRPTVVVDYAHTAHALEQVLNALRAHCRGRLWCVFGAGGDRDPGKRPLMGAVAEARADAVVLTDDNPRHEDPDAIIAGILAGMQRPADARVERDRAGAIALALAQAAPEDVVLVAGKGHESWQEVAGERRPFSDREVVATLLGEGAS